MANFRLKPLVYIGFKFDSEMYNILFRFIGWSVVHVWIFIFIIMMFPLLVRKLYIARWFGFRSRSEVYRIFIRGLKNLCSHRILVVQDSLIIAPWSLLVSPNRPKLRSKTDLNLHCNLIGKNYLLCFCGGDFDVIVLPYTLNSCWWTLNLKKTFKTTIISKLQSCI